MEKLKLENEVAETKARAEAAAKELAEQEKKNEIARQELAESQR